MRILGIDPGSQRTGFGVVDRHGSRLTAVEYGLITCGSQPLPDRLAHLAREVAGVVQRCRPDAAVLESLFHGVNVRSMIVLAQARGALVAALALEGLPIAEYAPAEVKNAVTGSGRADKIQVGRMVRLVLGLGQRKIATDATDALAVAICYAQRLRLDQLGAAGTPRGSLSDVP